MFAFVKKKYYETSMAVNDTPISIEHFTAIAGLALIKLSSKTV